MIELVSLLLLSCIAIGSEVLVIGWCLILKLVSLPLLSSRVSYLCEHAEVAALLCELIAPLHDRHERLPETAALVLKMERKIWGI
jgi:hypothetical protein